MRMFVMCALALSVSATGAYADSKSYCEIYAKDLASAKTSDVDEWQLTYRDSYKDCMVQYSTATTEVQKPKPVPPKKKVASIKQPETIAEKPAKQVELVEGSDEWNAYCDSKYASFNKETGTYMSHTGKERRCIVTP
jgi:BA14K-like protein